MNTPSIMSTEGVILSLFFGTTLFVIIYCYRLMQNKERLAMIERGMYTPKAKQNYFFTSMKIALTLIGGGAGLFFAFLLNTYVFDTASDKEVIYFALGVLFAGCGLFTGTRMGAPEKSNP